MANPSKIIPATFHGKFIGFVLAWLIIELLLSPLSSTGSALSPVMETRKMEARVFNLINRARSKQGLGKFKINNYLSSLARQHSLDMATGRSPFGHQGFEARTSLIKRQIGALYLAENVAYNEGCDDPANEAVKDWLASPEHLINIKGKYKLTGVGVASAGEGSYYYTQIFAR